MIPLAIPVISDDMIAAAVNALTNDRLVGGRSVKKFEEEFSNYVGVRYAIAVNSGTSALFLALKGLSVTKGDFVIAPSATFIATVNSIAHVGATPMLIDINLSDYTLDVKQLEVALREFQSRIKAIIPVHLYGFPSNMDEIMSLSQKFGVPIIEDACQSHGGSYKGSKLGSFGVASAFSFYSSKNITVGGDGGMILTNNHDLALTVEMLRNQGSSINNRYIHDLIGYNFRLNSVNAAIGSEQLRNLDTWVKNKRKLAKSYVDSLEGIREIVLPPEESNDRLSAWHLFVIRTEHRDKLALHLKKFGVETGIHYPIPVHKQRPYLDGVAITPYSLNRTIKWASEILSIPIYNTMSMEEVEVVVRGILSFFKERS